MTDGEKDELVVALQELVQELLAKLIQLRVTCGLKIKELEAQLKEK
jgi:hypothetical protein